MENLDMRLANGEISESTYDKLYAMWEARLKETGGWSRSGHEGALS